VRARVLLTVACLLAQLLLPRPVLAANDSTATAVRLAASGATASDQLTGNSGGAYRYYAFEYPGGAGAVPITMRAQPGHGTTGVAVGFNVYGPDGYAAGAITSDRSTTDSTYALAVSSLRPGTYYIQVFNYVQGLPMHFQLDVNGLTASAQPVGPGAGSSPGRAISTDLSSLTTGGQLAGSTSGAFAYYALGYPGGQEPMTITVGYSPSTPTSDRAVGCNLYRGYPASPGGSALAGQCAETGRNESSATTGFTYSGDAAERFLLQVFNYLPDLTVNYTLIVSGLAGPVAEVGDISSPDRAFVLSASQPAAVGTLSGDKSGHFHYYVLQYRGGNREVRITASTEPNARLGDGEFGFNLYNGPNSVGAAKGNLDDKSRRTATLIVNQSDAATLGIQVYNYSANNVDARYAITVNGL